MTTQRVKRSLRLDMTDLLRPELHRQFPPEVLFEVFRWMVQTGWDYRERGSGYYGGERGVYELLWEHSGTGAQGYGHGDLIGRDWREFLRRAFCRALLENWNLGKLGSILRWRQEFGVRLNTDVVLAISRVTRTVGGWEYASDGGIERVLDEMLSRNGGRLAVQLNECHAGARSVQSVGLRLAVDSKKRLAWQAVLSYGYKADCSSWDYALASQRRSEPFAWFVRRAEKEMTRLLGGKQGEKP
jgi:hypothetical protein